MSVIQQLSQKDLALTQKLEVLGKVLCSDLDVLVTEVGKEFWRYRFSTDLRVPLTWKIFLSLSSHFPFSENRVQTC